MINHGWSFTNFLSGDFKLFVVRLSWKDCIDTGRNRYGIMQSFQESRRTNNLKSPDKKFVNDQPWLIIHWSFCSLNLTRFGAVVLTKIDESKIFFWFFKTALHKNMRCSAIPKPISTKLKSHVANEVGYHWLKIGKISCTTGRVMDNYALGGPFFCATLKLGFGPWSAVEW